MFQKRTDVFTATGISTLVCAVLLASVLTDGSSLFKLRNERVMVGDAWISSLPMIDSPYTIGVFRDMYGHEWNSGNGIDSYNRMENNTPHPAHFVKLYKCDDHLAIGEIMMVSVLTAIIISGTSVISSILAISRGGQSSFPLFSLLLQCLQSVILTLIVVQSWLMYTHPYTCKSYPSLVKGVSAVSIRFSDIFSVSYAIPFFVCCMSIGIGNVVLIFTSGVFKRERSYKRVPEISVRVV